jgi:branched-chain amino acid aminotransferase
MLVFLNGQLVPEQWAMVSVFDRGFLYGDGLFETLRVLNGKPFRWEQHFQRLEDGARFLGITVPFSLEELRRFAGLLIQENRMPDALLRISLSRGVGPRGYSPKGADTPFMAMSLHAASPFDPHRPPRWRVITSSVRIAANEPLAQFKTSNKLPQIIARAEADAASAEEALLVDTNGHVVEASSSNLFWVEKEVVCSPPRGGFLPGVTRAVVMEICGILGVELREVAVTPEGLRQTDGVFLSLSSVGVAECVWLDGCELKPQSIITELSVKYWELAQKEAG